MNKKVKKLIITSSIIVGIILCVVLGIVIYSKTRITEKYAERINNAYASKDYFTYNEVMARLGKPFSSEITGTPDSASGYCEWFEGYVKGEESKFVKDYQKGKKVKAIYIEFLNGKAVGARFYIADINNQLEEDYETK